MKNKVAMKEFFGSQVRAILFDELNWVDRSNLWDLFGENLHKAVRLINSCNYILRDIKMFNKKDIIDDLIKCGIMDEFSEDEVLTYSFYTNIINTECDELKEEDYYRIIQSNDKEEAIIDIYYNYLCNYFVYNERPQCNDHIDEENYVYLIGNNEHCKIGITSNLKRRIRAIQNASPFKIEVLNVINVNDRKEALDLESRLHKICKDYNTINEWFIRCDEVESIFEKAKEMVMNKMIRKYKNSIDK